MQGIHFGTICVAFETLNLQSRRNIFLYTMINLTFSSAHFSYIKWYKWFFLFCQKFQDFQDLYDPSIIVPLYSKKFCDGHIILDYDVRSLRSRSNFYKKTLRRHLQSAKRWDMQCRCTRKWSFNTDSIRLDKVILTAVFCVWGPRMVVRLFLKIFWYIDNSV